jgi:M6 family metalloprotease-like protein
MVWLRPSARVLVAVLALVLYFVIVSSALATPADPNARRLLIQPDGKSFPARIWGDEYYHGYETVDGYTVIRDFKDGYWKYARRGPTGRLVPGTRVVLEDRPTLGRHLRPSAQLVEDIRIEEGGTPPAVPRLQATPPWAGTGTDILFIMVEFSGATEKCTFTPAQMEANMFGANASGPGNLDAFFNEVSRGAFRLDGDVVGDNGGTTACVPLANNRAFYNNNGANADGDDDLVIEALADIDGTIDFSQYDNDGNGEIDALGIIYAGGGAHDVCVTGSNVDNLWPHSGQIPNTNVDGGARHARPFIINSELTYSLSDPGLANNPITPTCNQIQTIGLFAHELGHSLGLPDLYDTDVGNGGVSTWSTMASQYLGTVNNADTPPHYDPWSKWHQGWITPTGHAANDRFIESISRVEDSGEVHRFLDNPNGVDWVLGNPPTTGTGQYFLVENRQLFGFDAQLAGCGILVWHIDESQAGNQNGGHSAGSHRLVDIDEADGLAELDANQAADNGDPFPGSTNKRLFDGSSNPNSDLYNGSDSGVRMWVQSTSCGSSMSAAFGPNQAPTASAGGPYSTPEGTSKQLTAAGSTDPDGDALTYAWDLDNDGQYDDSTSQTPTFTVVGDNYSATVGVQVTDSFGDSDTDTTTVTVTNVNPTAAIGLTGTVSINGVPTFIAHEGVPVPFVGTSTDPGSDDLTLTWEWDDGDATPEVATCYPNDSAILCPPAGTGDPAPSPTSNPRNVTENQPHAFTDACFYEVVFDAKDDDGGDATDAKVAVIIGGNASLQRGAGYWQTQYRPRPTAFSDARRLCYLEIVRHMSRVFSEVRSLADVAQAFDVLSVSNNGGSEAQKLDRELLAAWLNFANGAFDLTELVDTNGDKVADTQFATVMANAETVRIGPSTDAQKIAQRNILERINGK